MQLREEPRSSGGRMGSVRICENDMLRHASSWFFSNAITYYIHKHDVGHGMQYNDANQSRTTSLG